MLSLLQKHTVDLYDLEKREYQKLSIKAISLLKTQRFDLFAKLFYIKHRASNPELALKIYGEHIKAFNPNLKEPGRTDKNSLEDFVKAFDQLIDRFKEHEFDENISLVPISKDDVILDASHRIAALAYFNKKVGVLKFNEVEEVTSFDYKYFRKRGLPNAIADTIALSALEYLDHLCFACFYAPTEQATKDVSYFIAFNYPVLYARKRRLSTNGTKKLVDILRMKDDSEINSFDINRNQPINLQIVLFEAIAKEEIKKLVQKCNSLSKTEGGSCFISTNSYEVEHMTELFFSEEINSLTNNYTRSLDNWAAFKSLFKNVYLIRFKTIIAKYLKK